MASGPVFIICSPGLVFVGTGGVGSRFHDLRSRTLFRRYRWRRVLFSCFALPDSFSAVPRASGPVCKSCALGLVLGGAECVEFRFHVLRPELFSTVSRTSGAVFMFCAPGLVFGGTGGVRYRFHVLRSRTRFRRYRGRRVPFSCFARPDLFSAVPRASGLVFMFCAPGLVFVGTEGFRSLIHVLRSRTHFRRYRLRRVPFLRFALPDSFLAVPSASGLIFTFCTPVLIFGGT
jgi:hypothetical protein